MKYQYYQQNTNLNLKPKNPNNNNNNNNVIPIAINGDLPACENMQLHIKQTKYTTTKWKLNIKNTISPPTIC